MSAVMVAPTPVLNCLAVLQQAVSAVPTPVQEICMAAGCESLDGCNFSFRLHQHGGGIKPLLRALLFLESLQQRLQSCPPLKHALVMALKTHIVALRSFPRDSFTDRRVLPAQCFLALLDNGHGDNEAATAYQCSSTIIIWEKMLCPLWSCLRPFWQLMMSPDAVSLSALLPYMLAATAGDWHDAAATHSRYSSIATDVCHLFHAWPGLQFVATNGGLGLHPLVTCTSSSNMEHRSSREVGSSTVNDVRVIAATTLACAFDECVSISSDSDDEHEENHKFVAFEHADHSSAKLKLVDAGDIFFVLQEFDARWLQQTSRPSHNVFKDVFPCMRAAMHADCTASAGARAKCTQQLKASLLPGTLPGLEAAVLKYVDTFTNRVSDEFITDLSFQSLQTGSWLLYPCLPCGINHLSVFACFDWVCSLAKYATI